jgi:hypothetical protein
LKAKRVEISGKLFKELDIQEQAGFDILITGNELWFFLEYLPGHMWQLVDNHVLDRVSRKIETAKHRVTIFWGICGPLVVEWFPSDISSKSKYFCDLIAAKVLKVLWPSVVIPRRKQFFLYMNNAKPHNSKKITDFS